MQQNIGDRCLYKGLPKIQESFTYNKKQRKNSHPLYRFVI